MKYYFQHFYDAITTPPNAGDGVTFGTTTLILSINPLLNWFSNVLTLLVVGFLSRLLWEFARPVVEDWVQSKQVRGFFELITPRKEKKNEDTKNE